jgi:hypothetical protein
MNTHVSAAQLGIEINTDCGPKIRVVRRLACGSFPEEHCLPAALVIDNGQEHIDRMRPIGELAQVAGYGVLELVSPAEMDEMIGAHGTPKDQRDLRNEVCRGVTNALGRARNVHKQRRADALSRKQSPEEQSPVEAALPLIMRPELQHRYDSKRGVWANPDGANLTHGDMRVIAECEGAVYELDQYSFGMHELIFAPQHVFHLGNNVWGLRYVDERTLGIERSGVIAAIGQLRGTRVTNAMSRPRGSFVVPLWSAEPRGLNDGEPGSASLLYSRVLVETADSATGVWSQYVPQLRRPW